MLSQGKGVQSGAVKRWHRAPHPTVVSHQEIYIEMIFPVTPQSFEIFKALLQ